MTKPFSEVLYADDDNAKDLLVEFLAEHNFDNPHVNPDQYGIDVLAHRGGEPYAFEVEVKHNWRGDYFQYKTVHFAYRKMKFTERQSALLSNTFFVMFNHDRTFALRVDGVTFASSPVVSKNTIYTKGERFVEVPTDAAVFFRLPIREDSRD